MRRRNLGIHACAVALALLPASCSRPTVGSSAVEVSQHRLTESADDPEVQSVFEYRGGGFCRLISAECSSSVHVTREGVVTLADSEGEQSGTLDSSELAELITLLDLPLTKELLGASAWSCANAFDSVAHFEVTYETETRRFENVEGCLGGGAPGGGLPLSRLSYLLARVRIRLRDCPAGTGLPASLAEPVEGRGLCL